MKVWKLKALNTGNGQWQTQQIGGDEVLADMLASMMKWKAEGQQVRLEWSEQN